MGKQYYQSQYILNKCFENKERIVRATLNNAQDYLNAVYDNASDSLRVNIAGGMLPKVDDKDDLPDYADDGQFCPVVNSESGMVDFYEMTDGEWTYRGSTVDPSQGGGGGGGGGGGTVIPEDEQEALEFVTDHLEQLKEFVSPNYMIKEEDVVFDPENLRVLVQGEWQEIDDDGNTDNDAMTEYRIDLNGYAIGAAAYYGNGATEPSYTYVRILYESSGSAVGTSHVYVEKELFDDIASYDDGENILRVYYITNTAANPIKRARFSLNGDGTVTDDLGNVISCVDSDDIDGDESTGYYIEVSGYAMGAETYNTQEAALPTIYRCKISYHSDGVKAGLSRIYMDHDEYEMFSGYTGGKNILDVYYVSTVYPGSLQINESQFKCEIRDGKYMMTDPNGVTRNVEDVHNLDGNDETKVVFSMGGYVIDTEMYNEDIGQRERGLLGQHYEMGTDRTEIFFDQDWFEKIASMTGGNNVISVFTVHAGISGNANMINPVDNVMDVNSENAIANGIVAQRMLEMEQRIKDLEDRLNA